MYREKKIETEEMKHEGKIYSLNCRINSKIHSDILVWVMAKKLDGKYLVRDCEGDIFEAEEKFLTDEIRPELIKKYRIKNRLNNLYRFFLHVLLFLWPLIANILCFGGKGIFNAIKEQGNLALFKYFIDVAAFILIICCIPWQPFYVPMQYEQLSYRQLKMLLEQHKEGANDDTPTKELH